MNRLVNILKIVVILSLCKFTISHSNSSIIRIGRSLKGTDYCSMNCKNEKHIGCIHKNCQKLDSPCELVDFDEDAVVAEHNKLRNTFAKGGDKKQPNVRAANMMLLNWDNELAYLAACNLKPCSSTMTHDQCHKTEKFDSSGQNIAWKSGNKDCAAEVIGFVNMWYAEIKELSEDELKKFAKKFEKISIREKYIGHFTAVVWAKTTHIGCSLSNKGKECTFTCNYSPGGNKLTLHIYEEGKPTSKCPKGVSANKKYDALCGKEEAKQPKDWDSYSSVSVRPRNQKDFLILPLIISIAYIM